MPYLTRLLPLLVAGAASAFASLGVAAQEGEDSLLKLVPATERPACMVEPFADDGPVQHWNAISTECSDQRLDVQLAPPPPGPSAPAAAGLYNGKVEQTVSRRSGDDLMGTVKLAWAAAVGHPVGGLRTDRALLAAGGMLRVTDGWAVRLNVGRELTDQERSRARLASVWHPDSRRLLFAEWATREEQGSRLRSVGMRWWVAPERMAVDVTLRYTPFGPRPVEPMVSLSMPGFAR